jgi:hypothetical protein
MRSQYGDVVNDVENGIRVQLREKQEAGADVRPGLVGFVANESDEHDRESLKDVPTSVLKTLAAHVGVQNYADAETLSESPSANSSRRSGDGSEWAASSAGEISAERKRNDEESAGGLAADENRGS